MCCDLTQADLGPQFALVDPTVAAAAISAACAVVDLAVWSTCDKDGCEGVKLLAQHILTVMPGAGASVSPAVQAEKVGDVSITYQSATSQSGLFAGSIFGQMFALLLGQVELCSQSRSTTPFGVLC